MNGISPIPFPTRLPGRPGRVSPFVGRGDHARAFNVIVRVALMDRF